MLAFVAGPTLDIGQQIAYLQLFLLPYLLQVLCQALYPTYPAICKMTYDVFLQGRSWRWPLRGRWPFHSVPKWLRKQKQPSVNFGSKEYNKKNTFGRTLSRSWSPSSRLVVVLSLASVAGDWGSSSTSVIWRSCQVSPPWPTQHYRAWSIETRPSDLIRINIRSASTAMPHIAWWTPLTYSKICNSSKEGRLQASTVG